MLTDYTGHFFLPEVINIHEWSEGQRKIFPCQNKAIETFFNFRALKSIKMLQTLLNEKQFLNFYKSPVLTKVPQLTEDNPKWPSN